MYLASIEGERRAPRKTGERATCECCGVEVIAKCGEVIVEHWAHKRGKDCDQWYEPESQWHRMIKSILATPDRQEVVLRHGGASHRADVVLGNGVVVEVQRSQLSVKAVAQRESFYQSVAPAMVWVLPSSGDTWRTSRAATMAMTCRRIWVEEDGTVHWSDQEPEHLSCLVEWLQSAAIEHRVERDRKHDEWKAEHSDKMQRFARWAESFRVPITDGDEDESVNEFVDTAVELMRRSMPFGVWSKLEKTPGNSKWLSDFIQSVITQSRRWGRVTAPQMYVIRRKASVLIR